MNIELSLISRHRKELMGFAIVLILLYHSAVLLKIPCLQYLFLNGDIGVDLFAVLSGIGVFYSLSNRPSVLEFWKRRFFRIVPSFILVSVPYALFLVVARGASVLHFFSLVTGIAPLLGDYTFWFVSFIAICYLFCPFLFSIIKRHNTRGALSVAYFLFVWLMTLLFPSQLHPYMWIFRFADFILGMEIAKYVMRHTSVYSCSKNDYFFSLLIVVVLFIAISFFRNCSFPILYLSYLIVSIPLLLGLAYLLESVHLLKSLFSLLGGVTLEIYLLHEHICIPIIESISSNSVIVFLLSILLAVLCAFFISFLQRACTNLYCK